MKGANRKLFRKPGLARQAIGILASSNELADQVQSVAPNMMPRQPVQKFKTGGLASLLGITPAGYEMVDEELVARPGFQECTSACLESRILLEPVNSQVLI